MLSGRHGAGGVLVFSVRPRRLRHHAQYYNEIADMVHYDKRKP
jgi:hypothetical protein